MKIKVCGMREPENIQEIAGLQPDFLGFIFYAASKRFAGALLNEDILKDLPGSVRKVGVFVNEEVEVIKQLATTYGFDLLQLHGRETPAQCKELQLSGFKIVKAFSVDENFNFENTLPYEDSCDFFLFDTKGKGYGGNGITFDWQLLEKYTSDKPYFLSGGLSLQNINGIENISKQPYALDVNSGFELEPGLKDVVQVKQLMKQFKAEK